MTTEDQDHVVGASPAGPDADNPSTAAQPPEESAPQPQGDPGTDAQPGADGEEQPDAPEPDEDQDKPQGRASRDAARYRHQLRETETQLEKQQEHTRRLEDQILTMLTTDHLAAPQDLFKFIERDSITDEDGAIDFDAAQQAIAELCAERPYLQSPAARTRDNPRAPKRIRRPDSNRSLAERLGATGTTSWADLINREKTENSDFEGTDRAKTRQESLDFKLKRR